MFSKEWLPYALYLGIDANTFWTLNPRTIQPYVEAHKISVKEQNSFMHLQGIYVLIALQVVLGNMFSKKGSKALEYPEKPFELFAEETELTDDEKDLQLQSLVSQLKIMEFNFNNSNSKADRA